MPIDVYIKLLDEPFDNCASSCELTLTDTTGRQKEKYRLGVIAAEDIYHKIRSGEPVNLENRYVKDFSLKSYRQLFGLEPEFEVELRNFYAYRTMFDIDSSVDFSGVRFVGEKCVFSQCVFGDGPLSFYHTRFDCDVVDFSESYFGAGTANFQYAVFNTNSTNFDAVHFDIGDVQFVNVDFGNSHVSFKQANFGEGAADFHYSTFGSGNLSFDKASFGGGNVSFKRVDFGHGKVDFKRVRFGDGELDFSEANFSSGKAVFRSSHFGNGNVLFNEVSGQSDFIFDNAQFGQGKLSFFKAKFRKASFSLCQFNNYLDLRISAADKIDLSYVIVRDVVDMMPTQHAPVSLGELDLSGVRNLGQVYIDWKENRVRNLIANQSHTSNRQKSEQFLTLKQSYNATGRYADEDRAYVWYKRYELKADLEFALNKNKWNALWAYPTAFSKWLLFDKVGLYATEPLRVLFSVGVIYSLFSVLYLFLPLVADTHIDTGGGEALAGLNAVAKAFYFSAITFLTIGYGEYYPVGIMRLFASIEGYVGVFLMGYFSVAFVRKVLR
ncbi:MAG: hypothetical protein Kow0075_02030 [Salibacteraceae bacterium]